MAELNDQQVSNSQGIKSISSGASDPSEADSSLSAPRPQSSKSGPTEALIAAQGGAVKMKLMLWKTELDDMNKGLFDLIQRVRFE
jgi:hypothetical protein